MEWCPTPPKPLLPRDEREQLGIMSVVDSMFPPDYFPMTHPMFIVGEEHDRLAGCDVLASLYIQPGHPHSANETSSFTYVSHSIKEFFSNLEKVPEKFNNASAYHLCVDTQIEWDTAFHFHSTVHDPLGDEFKPTHGSGLDDLAKEIIKNVTNSPHNRNHSLLYLGSYITEGYNGCPEVRFDWEQNGQMHNLSTVAGTSGTEKTKKWLGVNNTESISKLSMVGTRTSQFVDTTREDAGATILSRYLPVQILFALFVAALVVSCA